MEKEEGDQNQLVPTPSCDGDSEGGKEPLPVLPADTVRGNLTADGGTGGGNDIGTPACG